MGEEEEGAHLDGDGDDGASCGIFDGGEAENLRFLGGMRVRLGSDNLGFEVAVW
jgi:hypothetical protein